MGLVWDGKGTEITNPYKGTEHRCRKATVSRPLMLCRDRLSTLYDRTHSIASAECGG